MKKRPLWLSRFLVAVWDKLPLTLRRKAKDGFWEWCLDDHDGRGKLVIFGVKPDGAKRVALLFNDQLIGYSVVEKGSFRFVIKRAKGRIEAGSKFVVTSDDGLLPYLGKKPFWEVEAPFLREGVEHLDIGKALKKGRLLTKKGTFRAQGLTGKRKKAYLTAYQKVREWFDKKYGYPVLVSHGTLKGTFRAQGLTGKRKKAYLTAYQKVREWFDKKYGYPVLVSHGTLLGFVREGDLISFDDDFDCLYFSAADNAEDVALERQNILCKLRSDGFTCFVGSTGHIKVRYGNVEVDLMPAWLVNGALNIAGFTVMPCSDEILRPFRWLPFAGGKVQLFARPEVFLEHQYGPAWRIPDPGYRSIPSAEALRNRKKLQPAREEVEQYGTASLRRKLEQRHA